MTVLTRYLLKRFLLQALFVTAGLTLLIAVFDVLANIEELTAQNNDTVPVLLSYMKLRLPGIAVMVMPFAALLAALMLMSAMVAGHETEALLSAGVNMYRLGGILLMGGVMLAVLQFAIAETIVTGTSARLSQWQERDYAGPPPNAPRTKRIAWAAAGDTILHYDRASPEGDILKGPLFIRRNDNGLLESYIRAQQAVYTEEGWMFEQIYGQTLTQDRAQYTGSMALDLPLTPDDFAVTADSPQEMSLGDLWGIVTSAELNPEQKRLYGLWFQRKFATPLGILVMVLLAAPAGLFLARQYNAFLTGFSLILTGFMFFVTERILLSMGETYLLPTFVAVWTPALLFGLMAGWFLLYKQE